MWRRGGEIIASPAKTKIGQTEFAHDFVNVETVLEIKLMSH